MQITEETKVLLSTIGSVLTIASFLYYLGLILKRKVEPHTFTWIVWTIITVIAFFAQLSGDGGAGAWVTGITALACLVVAILAGTRGTIRYTKFDFLCLVIALISIIPWLLTKNPLYSVIIVSAIDVIAFLPTFRRGYNNPRKDSALKFFIDVLKFVLGMIALRSYTVTTILYPLAVTIGNFTYMMMLLIRRVQIKKK